MPEPLIYQALEAFMEIYEDMWKYVECDDSQFHFITSSSIPFWSLLNTRFLSLSRKEHEREPYITTLILFYQYWVQSQTGVSHLCSVIYAYYF